MPYQVIEDANKALEENTTLDNSTENANKDLEENQTPAEVKVDSPNGIRMEWDPIKSEWGWRWSFEENRNSCGIDSFKILIYICYK